MSTKAVKTKLKPVKTEKKINAFLEDNFPAAIGKIFFWGLSLSISLSKYWLITKPEAVIAQKEIEIKNVLNVGRANKVLPTQKINNQLIQLLNLVACNKSSTKLTICLWLFWRILLHSWRLKILTLSFVPFLFIGFKGPLAILLPYSLIK